MSPSEPVFRYHERTKHHPYRYAESLGYLDWATQPDPFRTFAGARTLRLAEVAPTPEPTWEAVLAGTVAPAALDAASLAQLFYDSLALSAWKQYQSSRWALRVNPSSGNLHPTEGYLVTGAVAGTEIPAGVHHYAPRAHELELRRALSAAQWE